MLLFSLRLKKKNTVILPIFKNKTVLIYNGNNFIKLKIIESMIYKKFGKFIKTKRKKQRKQ